MDKVRIINSTLHLVNGNTTLPSHIVNHLTNIQRHMLLVKIAL